MSTKVDIESIERIFAACAEINKKLTDAGFESADKLLKEVATLRDCLEREEAYTELYRNISSDALGTCTALIDYINRHEIPVDKQVSTIIERIKCSTYQVPDEMGVPYIVVCSKGTWFSPEYLKCERKIPPLSAPVEAPAMRCDLVCTRCGAEFKDENLFIQGSETKIRFCPKCGAPIAGILEEI